LVGGNSVLHSKQYQQVLSSSPDASSERVIAIELHFGQFSFGQSAMLRVSSSMRSGTGLVVRKWKYPNDLL
jgi:hypothetical protein